MAIPGRESCLSFHTVWVLNDQACDDRATATARHKWRGVQWLFIRTRATISIRQACETMELIRLSLHFHKTFCLIPFEFQICPEPHALEQLNTNDI